MENFFFNGETKDYITVLRGSNRSAWAPVSRIYQDVANRPGTYIKKERKIGARILNIPIFIEGSNQADLQKIKEDLAVWLIHDEPKPLIFDDEIDRTYYAVVDGSFDPEEVVNFGEGVIPFICPDPFKYGAEVKVPANKPITNEGTAKTWPIITAAFTGATSAITVTHQDNGKSVRVIYNFSAGDVLEINLSTRKVRINGVINMAAYYWKNQPFQLTPGENLLVVEPTGVANVEVTYRPRWK